MVYRSVFLQRRRFDNVYPQSNLQSANCPLPFPSSTPHPERLIGGNKHTHTHTSRASSRESLNVAPEQVATCFAVHDGKVIARGGG